MADAEDVGGFAVVASVEDAAQFIVALQKSVGFVNHQGGAQFLDGAEEGGELTLAATMGRLTRTVRRVVLPQRRAGDSRPR